MYVPPEFRRRIWIACAVLPLVLPGWRGELVPVSHDEVMAAARTFDADDVFGVSRPGDRDGEEWHAQFMGSRAAAFLDLLALRGLAPRVVPPAYVAHIPPGAGDRPVRADAYFRVVTTRRWPWWWPGGGVGWTMPSR